MSVRRHYLSSYARQQSGLRRLEKFLPQNPPLVSKNLVNSISTMKRLCTSRKRIFNLNQPRSPNR